MKDKIPMQIDHDSIHMVDYNKLFTGRYTVVVMTHFGERTHGSYTFKDAFYICKIIMNNCMFALAYVRRVDDDTQR